MTEHFAMETMTELEEINCQPFLKTFPPITLFDFSSKQSFEEQSKFINMTMKLCESLLCKGITLACMALLDIIKDQIDLTPRPNDHK